MYLSLYRLKHKRNTLATQAPPQGEEPSRPYSTNDSNLCEVNAISAVAGMVRIQAKTI